MERTVSCFDCKYHDGVCCWLYRDKNALGYYDYCTHYIYGDFDEKEVDRLNKITLERRKK